MSSNKRKAAEVIDLTETKLPKRSSSCISALQYKDLLGPKAKPLSFFSHAFGTVSLLYCMVSFLNTRDRSAVVLRLSKMYATRSKSPSFWSNCVFKVGGPGFEKTNVVTFESKIPKRTKNNVLVIDNSVPTGYGYQWLESQNMRVSYRNLIRRHVKQGKGSRSFKSVIMNLESYPVRIATANSHSRSEACFNSTKYRKQLEMSGKMLTTVKNQAVLLFAEWDANMTIARMFPSGSDADAFQPTTLGIVIHQAHEPGYRPSELVSMPSVRTLVLLVIYMDRTDIQRVVKNWLSMCPNVENVSIFLMYDRINGVLNNMSTVQGIIDIPQHATLKNMHISTRNGVIGTVKYDERTGVTVKTRDRHSYEQQFQVTGFLSDLQNSGYTNMFKVAVNPTSSILDFKAEVSDTFYTHFGYRLSPEVLCYFF